MTLRSAWPRFSAALVATVAVYASGGCSFFYDLNTTQCEISADCQAFGPQFRNTTCVNRVCVEKSSGETGGMTSTGGTDNGGSGGKGGTSGGKGSSGGSGASDTGGTVGSSGEGNGADAGMGGEGTVTPPECSTNDDCITANLDRPFICRNDKCVSLLTDECPVLLPTSGNLEILRDAKPPIVLGGYARMTNQNDLKDTAAIINWDMAFEEFADAQSIPGKQPRMVGVICQGNPADVNVDASMEHLTQGVGAVGILSALAPDDLDAAWRYTQTPEYADAKLPPVFFMSTGSADLRLANLDDNGLVWHQIGDPRGLSATMASLVKRMEARVNAERQAYFNAHTGATGLEDPSVPLRVTLVYSDDPIMLDVAQVLTAPDTEHPENTLNFNGKTAIQNGANFRQVKIESGSLHNDPPAMTANGVNEVLGNPPHIVIGMGTIEFPQVMSLIESSWGTPGKASEGRPRPYYALSHFIRNQVSLGTPMQANKATVPPLNERTVGVSYALAQDTKSKELYDYYLTNLRMRYSGLVTIASTENHYDGAYGLLYSVLAATGSRSVIDGTIIRDGWLEKVIKRNGTSVDIGPTKINDTARQLTNAGFGISLWGTMGPPDFERLSGTRNSAMSAWCTQLKSGTTSTWEVQVDALLYNATTKMFTAAASPPTCIAGY